MKRWLVIGMWMVACLSIAISLTVLISPVVYRLYAQQMNLSDVSGLTLQQLQANYDVMWQYVVNPFEQGFQFLNFDMSVGGAKHFADVQQLIAVNTVVSCVGIVVILVSLLIWRRNRIAVNSPMLMVMLGLPVVMIMFFVAMFEPLFIAFHQLFFSNELWLFDPATDPIITVLPETFFLILFVLGAIFYEILLWFLYRKVTRNRVTW